MTKLNQIDTSPLPVSCIMGQLDELVDVIVLTNDNPAITTDLGINHVFRINAEGEDRSNDLTSCNLSGINRSLNWQF